MKLKSLILGSVAAAGLSTAGFAADLGVLTSLDVCDSLGISGLTLSSSDNCLQITGGVSYEYNFGDYRWGVGTTTLEVPVAVTPFSTRNTQVGDGNSDRQSKVEAWLKFVGTAASDFGPASATIKLKSVQDHRYSGSVSRGNGDTTASGTGAFVIDEAFVQVGDTTTIMAGKKGTIAVLNDDEPFNFLGLFNSDSFDKKGVAVNEDDSRLGGHVIQIVSEVADGVKVGAALENLQNNATVLGFVSYSGEGISGHVTAGAFNVIDAAVTSWFAHAGVAGSFDAVKVRAALGYQGNYKGTAENLLNGLVSAQGQFDLFTIAASAEFVNSSNLGADYTSYGFGGSIGAAVTEGVKVNLGARYFHNGSTSRDTTQVAAELVAALTETISATAGVGAYFGSQISASTPSGRDNIVYGSLGLDWKVGGGFTSSVKGEVNSENAYKVTFKAAKEFK